MATRYYNLNHLEARIKDSVDDDEGKDGEEPGKEGEEEHQDEPVGGLLLIHRDVSDLEVDDNVGGNNDEEGWEGKSPEEKSLWIIGNTFAATKTSSNKKDSCQLNLKMTTFTLKSYNCAGLRVFLQLHLNRIPI